MSADKAAIAAIDQSEVVEALRAWSNGDDDEPPIRIMQEAAARIEELEGALGFYQSAIGPLTGKPLTDEQWKRLHDIYAVAAAALKGPSVSQERE